MTWQRKITDLLVAPPVIYDLVQRVCGSDEIRRFLQPRVGSGEGGDVLDVGGGTGLYRDLWPAGWSYACLDNDPEKLHGFRRRNPQDEAILGDAAALPVADASLDVVFCTNVSHHLTDTQLESFARECARVLRPGGTLVLFDAVWRPNRAIARTLWKLDRGAFPRSQEALLALLTPSLNVQKVEQLKLSLRHEYVLCTATSRWV